ncbi:Uroporphyrinogen-III synthase [Buchnera aphidicola (Thelaxes suberi)]|uniref:uroporphyrinogen-III synthase n=1 Tax=Buchnera aphidicola TaxID=9 RepID=UPI00346485E6
MNILILRPKKDALELMHKLNKINIQSWIFPIFKFRPGKDLFLLPHVLQSSSKNSIVIASSKYAILYSHNYLKKIKKWPITLNYFAIGHKSARLLKICTKKKVLYPLKKENSEHLIKVIKKTKPIKDTKIIILQGNNSRNILAKELSNDGYNIVKLECYQRIFIRYNGSKEAKKWKFFNINMLIVTSSEMLTRLTCIFYKKKEKRWLFKCKILCISNRIYTLALSLGWKNIIICSHAHNACILKKIKEIYDNGRRKRI